jgi:NTP pyrophosphatase (non-canonical NTP hydrolase)
MRWNEYQEWVGTISSGQVECSIMGLAGEAGEVVDLLKKHLYHARPLDRAALTKELGDVLWYLTDVARAYGIPLDRVVAENVAKLSARFASGKFTPEQANARADER